MLRKVERRLAHCVHFRWNYEETATDSLQCSAAGNWASESSVKAALLLVQICTETKVQKGVCLLSKRIRLSRIVQEDKEDIDNHGGSTLLHTNLTGPSKSSYIQEV